MNVYLLAVSIYLIIMALAGVYVGRKSVSSSEDFIVAGRSLSTLVVAGTLLSTFIGSGLIIGGASFIYQYGPFAAIFNLSGGVIGTIILFMLARKIRKRGSYSIPHMIESRFGKSSRLISTILILFAYIGITGYNFTGGAYVLQITTGLPLETGAIIMAILVIFLTVSGGLFSVAYTDSLSALLIIFGFLIALPLVLNSTGGFSGLSASLPEELLSWNGGLTVPQLIGYFLPLFLLILGDQNMYQRFSASKSEKVAQKATIGFFFGSAAVTAMVILLATTAVVLFPNIDPDSAILKLGIDGVPVGVGVIIICASVAFLITTATSYLLSVSGNIVYDLYNQYSKKENSDKQLLRINRITVVLIGVFAYILAQFFPTVLDFQMYAYTMYGATITPVILATILWKKATRYGVITSMIVGGVVTIVWEMVLSKPLDWNSVLVALPLSLLTLIIISLLTEDKAALNSFKEANEL